MVLSIRRPRAPLMSTTATPLTLPGAGWPQGMAPASPSSSFLNTLETPDQARAGSSSPIPPLATHLCLRLPHLRRTATPAHPLPTGFATEPATDLLPHLSCNQHGRRPSTNPGVTSSPDSRVASAIDHPAYLRPQEAYVHQPPPPGRCPGPSTPSLEDPRTQGKRLLLVSGVFHLPGRPVNGATTTTPIFNPGHGKLTAHLACSYLGSCPTTGSTRFGNSSDYFQPNPKTNARTPQNIIKTIDLSLVTPRIQILLYRSIVCNPFQSVLLGQ